MSNIKNKEKLIKEQMRQLENAQYLAAALDQGIDYIKQELNKCNMGGYMSPWRNEPRFYRYKNNAIKSQLLVIQEAQRIGMVDDRYMNPEFVRRQYEIAKQNIKNLYNTID